VPISYTRPTTTTTLTSSANPSGFGHAVTYTATVTPAQDGGTVAFTDFGAPISGCSASRRNLRGMTDNLPSATLRPSWGHRD